MLVDRFHDAYTHTRGEFFLIRRLAGRWNFKNQCFSNNFQKTKILSCQVPRLPGPPNSPRVVEADRSLSCRRRRRHALLRLLERQVIRDDDESFYDYCMTRYEDDMVIVGNYNGYVKCAEAFLRLGLSHQVSEKSFVCVY